VPAKEPSGETPGDRSAGTFPDAGRYVAVFESALAALREAKEGEIVTLRAERDRAMTMADLERTRAERAEQALAGERQRADVLRDRSDQFRVDLEVAQQQLRESAQAVEGLRQADTARRARGCFHRLLAAWQGK